MKLLLHIITMLLFTTLIYSQNAMNVHSHDGSVTTFMMSEIDSITYTVDDGLFACGSSTVTYFGTTYNTVEIGSQCWLKENLDVGTMVNGGVNQIDNSTIEKYCYDNDPNNCSTYGGLYQWTEAMQYETTEGSQGICPSGWHIPTLAEYQVLSTIVNGISSALKAIGQGNGTNASSFSALLSGHYVANNGTFFNIYAWTMFQSSTQLNSTQFYLMSMFSTNNDIGFSTDPGTSGYSVRCLKD